MKLKCDAAAVVFTTYNETLIICNDCYKKTQFFFFCGLLFLSFLFIEWLFDTQDVWFRGKMLCHTWGTTVSVAKWTNVHQINVNGFYYYLLFILIHIIFEWRTDVSWNRNHWFIWSHDRRIQNKFHSICYLFWFLIRIDESEW